MDKNDYIQALARIMHKLRADKDCGGKCNEYDDQWENLPTSTQVFEMEVMEEFLEKSLELNKSAVFDAIQRMANESDDLKQKLVVMNDNIHIKPPKNENKIDDQEGFPDQFNDILR